MFLENPWCIIVGLWLGKLASDCICLRGSCKPPQCRCTPVEQRRLDREVIRNLGACALAWQPFSLGVTQHLINGFNRWHCTVGARLNKCTATSYFYWIEYETKICSRKIRLKVTNACIFTFFPKYILVFKHVPTWWSRSMTQCGVLLL